MKGETVFVAILEDRHTDDQIEVFIKVIHALKQITEWQAMYGTDYTWEEEEIEAWVYYIVADSGDGPHMRIERKVLR